ncbi:MAG TPA: hypothetical protein VFR47_29800 [Anaerolineales bacterium]|nr:hypothetical protein [Anaerolineales bacterium]
MLTDPKLRSQVDALWDKFWTGGLANPLNMFGADAVERWFTEKEVKSIIQSTENLEV